MDFCFSIEGTCDIDGETFELGNDSVLRIWQYSLVHRHTADEGVTDDNLLYDFHIDNDSQTPVFHITHKTDVTYAQLLPGTNNNFDYLYTDDPVSYDRITATSAVRNGLKVYEKWRTLTECNQRLTDSQTTWSAGSHEEDSLIVDALGNILPECDQSIWLIDVPDD